MPNYGKTSPRVCHTKLVTVAPVRYYGITKLQKVQERAVGLVSGLRSKDYLGRCEQLGLETLEKRRENQDLIQVYKILNNKDRLASEKLFETVSQGAVRVTRQGADPLNLRMENT